MSELEIREFSIRAVDTDKREVQGIAVPWDQDAKIGSYYTERFAKGAVQDSDGAKLYWRHTEPIGLITKAESTDAGWEITARISETPRGDEAYTLARDGVIDKFSVGFEPVEHRDEVAEDGSITRTRTNVRVKEVSLVPFPAYEGASVAQVRAAHTNESEQIVSDTITRADLDEVRESMEDIGRRVDSIHTREPEPVADTRSGGEILKAIANGDEDAIRAYTGSTSADGVVKSGWVGDLTRLVEEVPGIRGLFSTGTLPAEGNNIEYAVLATNTHVVAKQATEGADLGFGKVTLTTRTAPVNTFGGYTQLTRQAIERSSVNILDANLRAQALATGKALNAAFRAHFATERAAQVTAANTVAVAKGSDFTAWLDAIVDAAEKFEDNGLALDALVVDKAQFKAFNKFVGSDGRPLLTVSGTGANTVGSLDVSGLKGEIASIPIIPNLKQAAAGSTFVNRLAIRSYNSPVVRLQDDNIINLSKDFSVYLYSALATEIPGGIVPVTITAP